MCNECVARYQVANAPEGVRVSCQCKMERFCNVRRSACYYRQIRQCLKNRPATLGSGPRTDRSPKEEMFAIVDDETHCPDLGFKFDVFSAEHRKSLCKRSERLEGLSPAPRLSGLVGSPNLQMPCVREGVPSKLLRPQRTGSRSRCHRHRRMARACRHTKMWHIRDGAQAAPAPGGVVRYCINEGAPSADGSPAM